MNLSLEKTAHLQSYSNKHSASLLCFGVLTCTRYGLIVDAEHHTTLRLGVITPVSCSFIHRISEDTEGQSRRQINEAHVLSFHIFSFTQVSFAKSICRTGSGWFISTSGEVVLIEL